IDLEPGEGRLGNSINTYGGSDLDVVPEHHGAYYFDLDHLSERERTMFRGHLSGTVEYGFEEFRRDVDPTISDCYDSQLFSRQDKCIKIQPSSGHKTPNEFKQQAVPRNGDFNPGRSGAQNHATVGS